MNVKHTVQFMVVAVLFLALVSTAAPVQAQPGDEEANKALVLAWFDAEAAKEYDRMGEFFTEDVVRHSSATDAVIPGLAVADLETYRQFLLQTEAMFPGYYVEPLLVTAEGDLVAAYGIFHAVFPENGNALAVPEAVFMRLENGKVVEVWAEWDNLTWNMQQSAAPLNEAPISDVSDVVGVWEIYGEGWSWPMELTARGEVFVGNLGCAPDQCQEAGTFTVDNGRLFWQADPRATYEVYATKEGGRTVQLRFVLIGDDPHPARLEGLNGKTLSAW